MVWLYCTWLLLKPFIENFVMHTSSTVVLTASTLLVTMIYLLALIALLTIMAALRNEGTLPRQIFFFFFLTLSALTSQIKLRVRVIGSFNWRKLHFRQRFHWLLLLCCLFRDWVWLYYWVSTFYGLSRPNTRRLKICKLLLEILWFFAYLTSLTDAIPGVLLAFFKDDIFILNATAMFLAPTLECETAHLSNLPSALLFSIRSSLNLAFSLAFFWERSP